MNIFYKTKSMFLPKIKENKIIALAGNPNVGKSTVFNALTGMRQKTGNWTGKTVSNAIGKCNFGKNEYTFVDIPGTYSLFAHSTEEEVARDFICFGKHDATIVVVDATSLERNLNLVLQILEVTREVVVCVNLLDEAEKKKIHIDLEKLSLLLGVPVAGTTARSKKGLKELVTNIDAVISKKQITYRNSIEYGEVLEDAIENVNQEVKKIIKNKVDSRWLSLRLLDYDGAFESSIKKNLHIDLMKNRELSLAVENANEVLEGKGITKENIRDLIVEAINKRASEIYNECVNLEVTEYNEIDRKLDKILTSKATGIPIMLSLFGFIFWLTIIGANYPSKILSEFLLGFQNNLYLLLSSFLPIKISEMLVFGMYRTVAWIVSVMLPPMAIFFPLFTLLEDLGYLPRIAFNLDKCFQIAYHV